MESGFYLGSYDPAKVIVTIDSIPVIGFQDGDAIVVEKNEDFSNETVGIKGEVSRSINRNVSGTLTVTLQHNSPSIIQFEQMMRGSFPNDFPPVVPVAVYDASSAEGFGATWGWLKTDASHAFGDEVGSREYTFFLTSIRQGGFIAQYAPNLAFGLGGLA